jgi:uncharacterized metal-binding protein
MRKECRQGMDCTDIRADVINVYKDRKNRKILRVASKIETEFYMKKNRLQELILFCRKMGYRHLGIAFCIGLAEEVKVRQFKVSSVCSKVCGINKKAFDLSNLKEGRVEAICNPIAQARILNRDRTDLNIIFGLCMGKDILFSKYSDAPVTTLVVKDRVLAHNPIGAIYSTHYRRDVGGVGEGIREKRGGSKDDVMDSV